VARVRLPLLGSEGQLTATMKPNSFRGSLFS
jgi:hypothetical protein